MESPILITSLDILDKILVLNLNVTLWSARRKMTIEDCTAMGLPPDGLVSFGSKKICDPTKLAVFIKLKVRAINMLDKHGIRFLSGWAIPESKAGKIIRELSAIRDEFLSEKRFFLASYAENIADWMTRHPTWAEIISVSTVNRDYVDSRIKFTWWVYRVSFATDFHTLSGITDFSLHDEVENLGRTLFMEISRDAQEIWRKVFEGKTVVTHKAFSPLKTIRDKLAGLSFVDPHVVPVIALIERVLSRMPRRGNITGVPLQMLQELICILKERDVLVSQAQAILATSSGGELADRLGQTVPLHTENKSGYIMPAAKMFTASEPVTPVPPLDSMGLW